MSDKIFLDTNILLYSLSNDAAKKKVAFDLLAHRPVISTQVLNELANVAIKKFKMAPPTLISVIQLMQRKLNVVHFDHQTIENAIQLQARYQLQYYDALIIATGLNSNCNILYSEDMHHGLIVNQQLKVYNPFM
jgi:predicted nucleic acid-binding protein